MKNKTKCGLRRAHLVHLGKNVFESKVREKRKKKLGQGEKIKIVGVISSHFLLLSDQAFWVKKIQRDLR